MDSDDKLVSFPNTQKENDTSESIDKENKKSLLWRCNACNHSIFENDDKENPNNKVLPLNMGGIMIYCCPSCRTLQLPEEIFNEILKKATSRIIT